MWKRLTSFFIGKQLENTRNYHDRIKLNANFYFALLTSIGFLIALFPTLLASNTAILRIPVFSGLAFSSLMLISLKFGKTIASTAVLFVIFGWGVAFGNLFFNTEVLHIGAPLWLLIVVLYAFYNLGRVWGIIVSAISFLGYIYWIVYLLEGEAQRVAPHVAEMVPLLVLEVSMAFTLLVAMALIYHEAVTGNEKMSALKAKQLKLNESKSNREEKRHRSQLQQYFEEQQHLFIRLQKNTDHFNMEEQYLEFNHYFAILSAVIAIQSPIEDMDAGFFLHETTQRYLASKNLQSTIVYSVDYSVDFIPAASILQIGMTLLILLDNTAQRSDHLKNIAIRYALEGHAVAMTYLEHSEGHSKSDQRLNKAVEMMQLLFPDIIVHLNASNHSKGNQVKIIVENLDEG